jgi:hypothetical protein
MGILHVLIELQDLSHLVKSQQNGVLVHTQKTITGARSDLEVS